MTSRAPFVSASGHPRLLRVRLAAVLVALGAASCDDDTAAPQELPDAADNDSPFVFEPDDAGKDNDAPATAPTDAQGPMGQDSPFSIPDDDGVTPPTDAGASSDIGAPGMDAARPIDTGTAPTDVAAPRDTGAPASRLCAACTSNAMCEAGGLCLRNTVDRTRFCSAPCGAGCRTGYTCASIATSTGPSRQCVPSSGRCDSAVDAGTSMDLGVRPDIAPPMDTGVRPDVAPPMDTGVRVDTGAPVDTGVRVDTGSPVDVPPGSLPTIGGCPIFPADNPWNQDISGVMVHPNSAAIIANINSNGETTIKADFGSDPAYGLPYIAVPETETRRTITFNEYPDESDPGPYPVPLTAPIEGGNDHHVLVVQSGTCMLYEMYHATPSGSGWRAGSGAVFNLRSNALRPRGWTSCDQAGLPILPGLARYDEVTAGEIRHALRVTFSHTRSGWIPPATHPGGNNDTNAPPMGLRMRLRASYDISRFTGQSRVILNALRRYGMFVADTGTNWYVSGATDRRWNDTDLRQLTSVPGTAFEVVYTGAVQTF